MTDRVVRLCHARFPTCNKNTIFCCMRQEHYNLRSSSGADVIQSKTFHPRNVTLCFGPFYAALRLSLRRPTALLPPAFGTPPSTYGSASSTLRARRARRLRRPTGWSHLFFTPFYGPRASALLHSTGKLYVKLRLKAPVLRGSTILSLRGSTVSAIGACRS